MLVVQLVTPGPVGVPVTVELLELVETTVPVLSCVRLLLKVLLGARVVTRAPSPTIVQLVGTIQGTSVAIMKPGRSTTPPALPGVVPVEDPPLTKTRGLVLLDSVNGLTEHVSGRWWRSYGHR